MILEIHHLWGCMMVHAIGSFWGMDANSLRLVLYNPKVVVLQLANIRKRFSSGADEYVTVDAGVSANIRSKPTSMEETTGHYQNVALGDEEK